MAARASRLRQARTGSEPRRSRIESPIPDGVQQGGWGRGPVVPISRHDTHAAGRAPWRWPRSCGHALKAKGLAPFPVARPLDGHVRLEARRIQSCAGLKAAIGRVSYADRLIICPWSDPRSVPLHSLKKNHSRSKLISPDLRRREVEFSLRSQIVKGYPRKAQVSRACEDVRNCAGGVIFLTSLAISLHLQYGSGLAGNQAGL